MSVSRRRFLQAAAASGAAAVVPSGGSADAQATRSAAGPNTPEAKMPNPVVPNFNGQYGSGTTPQFQAPKRAMGSTGLQCSILGVGGYHLGTVPTQDEVNNMVAKSIDHGINFFDN